MAVLCGWLVGV